jgi:hypothetical protein
MFRSGVTSAARAVKLLLWRDTLPRLERVHGRHTPGRITALTVSSSEAWAAFRLQCIFWSLAHLQICSQRSALQQDRGLGLATQWSVVCRSWSRVFNWSCITTCKAMCKASSSSRISVSVMRPRYANVCPGEFHLEEAVVEAVGTGSAPIAFHVGSSLPFSLFLSATLVIT